MQSDSSSIDTLRDNLLRAVDAEYNVIKAKNVWEIICQLENMEITKDQLQTTRLGREINTIRQKIDARKKNEKCSELILQISQRAKKLLRSWQSLLNTSQTDSSSSPINREIKPRLILKVKLNSPERNRMNNKRKRTSILTETNCTLPRLKTTQQPLLHTNWENGSSAGSPISSLTQSDLASYNTVADLVKDHRQRILAEHDSRELEARPDLLLVPVDQLAFVYEREKIKEFNLPIKSKQSSMTIIEKLDQSSNLIALPFIDCPIEFDLALDELIVQYPTMDMY